LILAATCLRRVFIDDRSLAAGAPALTHIVPLAPAVKNLGVGTAA